MDDYIRKRKGGNGPTFTIRIPGSDEWAQRKGAKLAKKAQAASEDVPEEDVKRVMASQPVRHEKVDYRPEADNRPGFFSRMLGSLFGGREEEEVEVQMEPAREEHEIDPELVEVLRISGKWLNKLDGETKKAFRESQDYAKYKYYIDKHGLTKRKE